MALNGLARPGSPVIQRCLTAHNFNNGFCGQEVNVTSNPGPRTEVSVRPCSHWDKDKFPPFVFSTDSQEVRDAVKALPPEGEQNTEKSDRLRRGIAATLNSSLPDGDSKDFARAFIEQGELL